MNKDQKKNGKCRFPDKERQTILESIRYVDKVVISIDTDDSVAKTLNIIKPDIFAKGQELFQSEIQMCLQHKINIANNENPNLHVHDLLCEFK